MVHFYKAILFSLFFGVLDGHADQISLFIDIDQHVVADFPCFENRFVEKLNEGGVGVFEIGDFHKLRYWIALGASPPVILSPTQSGEESRVFCKVLLCQINIEVFREDWILHFVQNDKNRGKPEKILVRMRFYKTKAPGFSRGLLRR